MTVRLELVEPVGQIERKIKRAIAEEINKLVNKRKRRVVDRIKQSVDTWILSSPEIISLQAEGNPGSLNAEFGLDPGQGSKSATDIVNAVQNSIEVEITRFDERLRGEVNFHIQPDSFRNLLDLPSGFVFRESGILHWMNWLLLLGNQVIVYGYSYSPGVDGLSGGGTMESGGVWRVPPQYAGISDNNFITRALAGRTQELQNIIVQVLFA